MQRKPINEEHFVEILTEMCSRVKQDYKKLNDDEFFKSDDWYTKFTWTMEEQDDFASWLGKFLRTHKYVTQKTYRNQDAGVYLAWKFLIQYGWKATYKDDEVRSLK